MATVFTPQHSSLDSLFAGGTTYRIPPYQRPYSWQAVGRGDRDSQVIQMWDDLWNFFEENRDNNREYFLGSMVIVEEQEKLRTFEVIDGQQRLTTLVLLFAAMRCFLQEAEKRLAPDTDDTIRKWFGKAIQTLESFTYNEASLGLVPTLKLKVERTVLGDFNQILEAALAGKTEVPLGKLEPKNQEIAARYFKNRDYFLSRLREKFFAAGAVSIEEVSKFNEFFKFLQARVAIVQIKSADFTTAYRIFEILNNRGLPLSSVDLLRNFVLQRLDEAKIADPDKQWERLEAEYPLTEFFIGRWTESISAAQPRMSAFNDAQSIYERNYSDSLTEKKIERFYRDLEQHLAWYKLITNSETDIDDVSIRNAVSFLKLLNNERYTYDVLLALFRHRKYDGGEDAELASFLRTYRSHALHVYLVGRFSSQKSYAAIKHLNDGKLDQARQAFVLTANEKKDLADFLNGPIESNDYAKRLIFAYVWACEEDVGPDVVKQFLQYDQATLEHIIPQHPADGSNWLKDFSAGFRKDFTYRLGNMTLLTASRNSANKNYDFAKKKKVYAKSHLAMTTELAAQTKLTPDYMRERQRRIVDTLRKALAID
ncbi:DUF262 domain-containing protein [Corallococcus sp. AS-1-12]|uniref:DUF262 domain-containing protein n=1 Tax=Corallococcus sp. AS-1-12 TaxID=2874598 RepID=UPI001CC1BB8C|nr:DUF262 domain-containing protein [Corallococcus sp. AS-1-12]MBZ4331794.1 DUF262 domain-containing HNH endonuclease family protein [Corallococcus sp. AS-1-12]